MALIIKDFKVKGVIVPEAYVKIINAQGGKYNGVHAGLGVYSSKEKADESMENMLDSFSVTCAFGDGNFYKSIYDSVKSNEPFSTYEIVDA